MKKIKTSELSSIFLALSMLLYAFRGKVGAIFITIELLIVLLIILKQKAKQRSWASKYAAIFLFIFAFVLHIFRSISAQYYLCIGYLLTPLLLMETKKERYNELWKWLKGIAVFEAIGVYTQFLFPSLYYTLISIILPSDVISSIRTRLQSGYYTGFSHEVSFTMFLIVIGLGLYLYDSETRKKRKKWFIIVFLFSALFISGKRATLLFFIVAFFMTQFIQSDSKVKIIKYGLIAVAGVVLLRITYPWWSQLPALSRVNEFIKFFTLNDVIGMTSGRTVIYENAIRLWKTNRWFGIGWGNFKYSINQSFWFSGFDVHNCFLQILCETGIVGLFFYSILCITSLINSIRAILLYRRSENVKTYRLAVFCCYIQIFFVLYSLTEPILYEYTDYVIYFVCFNCSNLLVKSKVYSNRIQHLERNRPIKGSIYEEVIG